MNDKLPWNNETEFYNLYSNKIFSEFDFYHTSMFGTNSVKFSLEIIKRAMINKNSKVLDLGCGSGYLVNYLRRIVKSSVGISTSKNCIEQCKKNYPESNFYIANMEDFNFKGMTHILSLESLGYSDINRTFSKAYSNLIVGGIFYVKELIFINHKNKLAIENKVHYYNYWKHKLNRLDIIIKSAIDAGFTVISIKNISNITNNKVFYETRKYNPIKYNILHPEVKFLSPFELIFMKL